MKLSALDLNGAWLNFQIKKPLLVAHQNYVTQLHLMMEFVMISITKRSVAMMVEIVVTTNKDGTLDAKKTMV